MTTPPKPVWLYECSTPLGLATLLEMVRRETDDRHSDVRRVLLVTLNGPIPEVFDWFADNTELAAKAKLAFDGTVCLNDALYPYHPKEWRLDRKWRDQEGVLRNLVGGRVARLFVESIQAPPANTLVRFFATATIDVYSDGLQVYGPTRVELPQSIQRRVDRVHFVDYVPDVVPLLLMEARRGTAQIKVEDLKPYFCAPAEISLAGAVLLVGQSLSEHGISSGHSEANLYTETLMQLWRSGVTPVYKPHPGCAAEVTQRVIDRFRELAGVELEVANASIPVEALLATGRCQAVVGVFSTALFTIPRQYGLPAFSVGTLDTLHKIRNVQNSNRIPLVAADILLPKLASLIEVLAQAQSARPDLSEFLPPYREATPVFQRALVAVGHAMQPKLLANLADEAQEILVTQDIPNLAAYVRERPSVSSDEDRHQASDLATGLRLVRRDLTRRTTRRLLLRLVSKKKLTKFDEAPDRFFSESTNGAVRLLGTVYRSLTK